MGKGVLIPSYCCNQRCSCCYAMADILQAKESMSLAEAKVSIDFFKSIGISTYTLLGGEPLIYPHILEVIQYALEQNITSWVVTNGSRLTDADFGRKLVDSGVLGGCISLFTTDAHTHDAITHVTGSFSKVYQALENILKYDWPFYPMFTVGRENLNTIENDVRKIAAMGFHKIYINYGIPNVISQYDTDFDADPQRLARMTEKLYLLQNQLDTVFIFNREKNKIPICLFDPEIFEQMYANGQIGYGCELVQGNTVVIEPGGSVLGCSHWVKNELLNIYKDYNSLTTYSAEEFWDIWMNGYPCKMREMQSYYPYARCDDCQLRKDGKCFGGCKAWHHKGVL